MRRECCGSGFWEGEVTVMWAANGQRLPTGIRVEYALSLKTAKALGLTIPPSVVGRADEVIQ
jgi:hypothetical protein